MDELSLYDRLAGVDEALANKVFRYELNVIDDDTEEEVFFTTTFSQESLQEELYKADGAIVAYTAEALELERDCEA